MREAGEGGEKTDHVGVIRGRAGPWRNWPGEMGGTDLQHLGQILTSGPSPVSLTRAP